MTNTKIRRAALLAAADVHADVSLRELVRIVDNVAQVYEPLLLELHEASRQYLHVHKEGDVGHLLAPEGGDWTGAMDKVLFAFEDTEDSDD